MYYIQSKLKSVELRIKHAYSMLDIAKRFEPQEVKDWEEVINSLERRKTRLITIYQRRKSDNWYRVNTDLDIK